MHGEKNLNVDTIYVQNDVINRSWINLAHVIDKNDRRLEQFLQFVQRNVYTSVDS